MALGSIPEPCGLLPSTLACLLRAMSFRRALPLRALSLGADHDTTDGASRRQRTALRAVPTNEKSPTTVLHLRFSVSHVGLGDLGLGFEVLHLGFEDWGLGFAILHRILEAQTSSVGICVWGSRFGAKTS